MRLSAFLVSLVLAALCVAPASAQYKPGGVNPNALCSATANLPIGCAPTSGDTNFYAAPTNSLTQFIAAPPAGQSIRITFIAFSYLDSAGGGAGTDSRGHRNQLRHLDLHRRGIAVGRRHDRRRR